MKSRRKQEWNSYLTDGNRFKITKEELEKRKKLLESKHNILSDNYQPPKLTHKAKMKIKKLTEETIEEQESNLESMSANVGSLDGGKSSLDLIALDSDNEETHQTPSKQQNYSTPRKSNKSTDNQHKSSSKTNTPRSVASKDEDTRERRQSSRSLSPSKTIQYSSMSNIKTPTKQPFIGADDRIEDEDVGSMLDEIKVLLTELRYYEEVSGRKSILEHKVRMIFV